MKKWLLMLTIAFLGKNAVAQDGFTLDASITGFAFERAPDMSGNIRTFAYSNPEAKEVNFSHFVVAAMPHVTFERVKAEAEKYYVSRRVLDELKNMKTYDTVVNGYKAYVYEYNSNTYGNKSNNYDVFLTDGTNAVCFSGVDMDNGQYIQKYKATLETLVLK